MEGTNQQSSLSGTPQALLRADHARIECLLSSIKECKEPSQSQVLVHELFLELRRHSVAETQMLHPAKDRPLPRKESMACGNASYAMLALMLQLEDKHADASSFDRTLATLLDKFQDHRRGCEDIFNRLSQLSQLTSRHGESFRDDLTSSISAQSKKLLESDGSGFYR